MEDCSFNCVFRQLPSGLLDNSLPPEAATEYFTEHDEKKATKTLYESLSVKTWQTRILQLKRNADKNSPITCRLFVADVIHYEGLGIQNEDGSYEVRYEALSYEWGDPRLCHSISVNGVRYPIRDNLFRALRQLRTDRDRYLWVDALCINQSDNDEKSTQVRRMLTIYQKASKVVIWNPYWNDAKTEAFNRLLKVQYEDIKKAHSAECSENIRVIYKFLRSVRRPPLFSRTWIRQEVYGARDLILQCGDYSILWEALSSMKKTIENLQIFSGTKITSTEIIPTDLELMRDPFFATRKLYDQLARTTKGTLGKYGRDTTHMKTTLLGALLSSPYFKASDPRDIIYGILGLTDVVLNSPSDNITADQLSLAVDYNLTVSEVYRMAALYLIKRSKSLAILDVANWRGQDSEELGLPSWVPDWRYAPLWRDFGHATFDRFENFAKSMHNSFVAPISANQKGAAQSWFQGVGWASWEATIQELLPNGDLPTQGICLATLQKDWPPLDLSSKPISTESVNVEVLGDYVTGFKQRLDDKKSLLTSGENREFRPVIASDLGIQILKSLLGDMKSVLGKGGVTFLLEQTNYDWVSFLSSTAVVPQQGQEGDKICLLRGNRMPFVLRPRGDRFLLVGPAFYPLWNNYFYLERRVGVGEKKKNGIFEIFAMSWTIRGNWTELVSDGRLENFNLV
ncbi:heterokaryon incompatibility protein-domain-containing protein [Nemania abortiva]|nr:heterokaryon incompatibility protein-domain-containing protein [Nemania abortiva]